MEKNKSFFERYLEAIQKTGDTVLAWQYQKNMCKQALLDKDVRDGLKREILADLRNYISATVDVTEIIQEIDDLQKRIDNLGK